MSTSLNLGRVFGVKIKVHWTFYMLFLWFIVEKLVQDINLNSVWLSVLSVLTIFICVILHEFGHYLIISEFGADLDEVNVLPIGGVYTFKKELKSPKEELLISIAGPLVSVYILLLLLLLYILTSLSSYNFNISELNKSLNDFTVQSFLGYLFKVNLWLLIFNLIPVFPMDGGNVLRSVLTLKTNKLRATKIISNIGLFLVLVFLFLGFIYNILFLFIAVFILLGSYNENEFVKHMTLLKNRRVKDAMLTDITTFKSQDYLHNAVSKLVASTEKDFIIKDNELIKGVLYHNDIVNNSTRRVKIKDIMNYDFKTIEANEELSKVYSLLEVNI